MRLKVEKIEYDGQRIFVAGTTDVGQIKGVWHYREAPTVNAEYCFEISIPELDRSEVTLLNNRLVSGIGLCDNKVLFICTVESIEEDGVYIIRLDHDWIEVIGMIRNDDYVIKEKDCVSFSVSCDEISIYPYD